jgi:hypothetical protein
LLFSCAHRPAPPTLASAGERGPAIGIELQRWIIDDDPFDDKLTTGEAPRALAGPALPLAEVFAPYLNRPVPVEQETRDLWKSNGLRLLCVPRKDLDHIRESLRLVGPVQQQPVGESLSWMPAIRGPSWNDGQAVVLDDGPLHLGPGCLRLLMRCWLTPALANESSAIAADPKRRLESGAISGAIQIELVPQHFEPIDRSDLTAVLKPKPTQDEQGFLFSRLLLEASFSADDALLIIPERPDTEWRSKKQAQSADAPANAALGPPMPGAPTLGDVMLTDLPAGGHRNIRFVLVVAPNPPRRFQLLAGAEPRP